MKPRITSRNMGGGIRKWYCESKAYGSYGPYARVGSGYTPREAYTKWVKSLAQELWQEGGKRKGSAQHWFVSRVWALGHRAPGNMQQVRAT